MWPRQNFSSSFTQLTENEEALAITKTTAAFENKLRVIEKSADSHPRCFGELRAV